MGGGYYKKEHTTAYNTSFLKFCCMLMNQNILQSVLKFEVPSCYVIFPGSIEQKKWVNAKLECAWLVFNFLLP